MSHSRTDPRLLTRVAAQVERGERVSVDDVAALFAVSDITALARIARVPRERRWGDVTFLAEAEEAGADGGMHDASEPVRGLVLRARTAPAFAGAIERARALARTGRSAVVHASVAAFDGADTATAFAALPRDIRLILTFEGAELLDPSLRDEVAPGAIAPDRWLALHRAAHNAGIPSVASMTYLTVDAPRSYAEHLHAIRSLQDETDGFTHFVPVPYHDARQGESFRAVPTAVQSLRAIAVSRIALDNVPHICAAPLLAGAEIAAVALAHGADTYDATVQPEGVASHRRRAMLSIVSTPTTAPSARVRVTEARFRPVQVDAAYTAIEAIPTGGPSIGDAATGVARGAIVHHS